MSLCVCLLLYLCECCLCAGGCVVLSGNPWRCTVSTPFTLQSTYICLFLIQIWIYIDLFADLFCTNIIYIIPPNGLMVWMLYRLYSLFEANCSYIHRHEPSWLFCEMNLTFNKSCKSAAELKANHKLFTVHTHIGGASAWHVQWEAVQTLKSTVRHERPQ